MKLKKGILKSKTGKLLGILHLSLMMQHGCIMQSQQDSTNWARSLINIHRQSVTKSETKKEILKSKFTKVKLKSDTKK